MTIYPYIKSVLRNKHAWKHCRYKKDIFDYFHVIFPYYAASNSNMDEYSYLKTLESLLDDKCHKDKIKEANKKFDDELKKKKPTFIISDEMKELMIKAQSECGENEIAIFGNGGPNNYRIVKIEKILD